VNEAFPEIFWRYLRGRYLEIDDGGSEGGLGELRRVIDGVTVEHNEL